MSQKWKVNDKDRWSLLEELKIFRVFQSFSNSLVPGNLYGLFHQRKIEDLVSRYVCPQIFFSFIFNFSLSLDGPLSRKRGRSRAIWSIPKPKKVEPNFSMILVTTVTNWLRMEKREHQDLPSHREVQLSKLTPSSPVVHLPFSRTC